MRRYAAAPPHPLDLHAAARRVADGGVWGGGCCEKSWRRRAWVEVELPPGWARLGSGHVGARTASLWCVLPLQEGWMALWQSRATAREVGAGGGRMSRYLQCHRLNPATSCRLLLQLFHFRRLQQCLSLSRCTPVPRRLPPPVPQSLVPVQTISPTRFEHRAPVDCALRITP
jgi:hypothetical protein